MLLFWPATGTKSKNCITVGLINVKVGCEKKCGHVSVLYPFEIGNSKCSMNSDFVLEKFMIKIMVSSDK